MLARSVVDTRAGDRVGGATYGHGGTQQRQAAAWRRPERKENFANSREIEEKYYEKIDKFIEELCETPLLETKMVMDAWPSVGDTDMYHLFFQRSDGEVVQVCIFSDYGCVYFYDKQENCMKIDGDILYEVLKVLWVHW